jgi:tRNA 5-methylaminomethyl-2-thiouridine biosynthesis bifunctional protein
MPLAVLGDPELGLSDGVPISGRFGDVYFSREDGLAETGHVFLEGCGLPEAWQAARSFTIGETGFGVGLNFLATWALWRRSGPADGVLHYLSVEGFPVDREGLAEALSGFPGLAPLAAKLTALYPEQRPGHHRIWFEGERVCLTLIFGEVADALRSVSAGPEGLVDAWFLDGFAPSRNPEMWRAEVLEEIGRLGRDGARLASFTAAGAVRRALAEIGFEIARRPGYGRKSHCIAGRLSRPTREPVEPWFERPARTDDGTITIVGAGIAGAAMVRALSRRGRPFRWIDRHGDLAREASGNPVGIIMPRPQIEPTPSDALSAAAFRYNLAEIEMVGAPYHRSGVLELATDETIGARHRRLAEAGALDPFGGRIVDAEEASRIAGVAVPYAAIHYPDAGYLVPADWAAALAGGHRPERLDFQADAMEQAGGPVVMCGGAAAADDPFLLGIPIEPVRGALISRPATEASSTLRVVLTHGGYTAPAVDGVHAVGATYDRIDPSSNAWKDSIYENDLNNINKILPDFLNVLMEFKSAPASGRASLRATTSDRLPVAGPVADAEGYREAYGFLGNDARITKGPPAPYRDRLHVLSGLGSRGLMTAPLLAELVVGLMFDEPLPVDATLARALHPARFVVRDLKRRRAGPGPTA